MKRHIQLVSLSLILMMIFSCVPVCAEGLNSDNSFSGKVIMGDYLNSAIILPNCDLLVSGNNNYGQLGYKGKSLGTFGRVLEDVKYFSTNDGCMAAIKNNGDLYVWGETYNSWDKEDTSKPEKVAEGIRECLPVNSESIYLINEKNELYLLGKDYLDEDSFFTYDEPELVLENVAHVDGGIVPFSDYDEGGALLIVMDNGDMYILEQEEDGLEDPKYKEKILQSDPIMENVMDAELGDEVVAAVTYDHELFMWGEGSYGQLREDEDSDFPVKVLDGIKKAALSENTAYALTLDGDFYSWGGNDKGTLGRGNEYEGYISWTPEIVMHDVIDIDAGDYSALILTNDGNVFGIGDNGQGQLGLSDNICFEPTYILNTSAGFETNQAYTPAFTDMDFSSDIPLHIEKGDDDLHIFLSYTGLQEDYLKDDLTIAVMFSDGDTLYEFECNENQDYEVYGPYVFSYKNEHASWSTLWSGYHGTVLLEGDRLIFNCSVEELEIRYEDIKFLSVTLKNKVNDIGVSYYLKDGNLEYWDDQDICDKYIEFCKEHISNIDFKSDTVLEKWIEWKDLETRRYSEGEPVEILNDESLAACEVIEKYNLIFNGIADENQEEYTLTGSYAPLDSGIHVDVNKKDIPGEWGVDIGTRDFSVFGLTVGSTYQDVDKFISAQDVIDSNSQLIGDRPNYQYFRTAEWALSIKYEEGRVRSISYTPLDPDVQDYWKTP